MSILERVEEGRAHLNSPAMLECGGIEIQHVAPVRIRPVSFGAIPAWVSQSDLTHGELGSYSIVDLPPRECGQAFQTLPDLSHSGIQTYNLQIDLSFYCGFTVRMRETGIPLDKQALFKVGQNRAGSQLSSNMFLSNRNDIFITTCLFCPNEIPHLWLMSIGIQQDNSKIILFLALCSVEMVFYPGLCLSTGLQFSRYLSYLDCEDLAQRVRKSRGGWYCRLVFRTLSLFHCCLIPLESLLANSGDFGRLNVKGVCCYSRTVIWGKGGAFLPGAYRPMDQRAWRERVCPSRLLWEERSTRSHHCRYSNSASRF